MSDRKTVGIVTVYRTENCGSFWQAYVLMKILEGNNCAVKFVKYNNICSQLHIHCSISTKKILKNDLRGFFIEWKKFFSFKRARRVFPLMSIKRSSRLNTDCIVIGSDTIWNIDVPYFLKNVNIYFGNVFTSKKIKCISYAASVGNTDMATLSSNSAVICGLSGFDNISVRDKHTQNIVEEIIKKRPSLVCDPTLLWTKDEYNLLIRDRKIISDAPILIYYFGTIPKEIVDKILQLKKHTGKRIVSFGESREWCDQVVSYDPLDFLQFYRDSSFVVTNTFHGTIFSMIFQKKFVDYGTDKKKVCDLLHTFGLSKYLLTKNIDLCSFYEDEMDFEPVELKIQNVRDISLKYLNDSI